MRAQILSMESAPRTSRHDAEAEASLSGFSKACAIIHQLSGLRTAEQQTAIENWAAAECGKLTREERDALREFYGWERAP